MSTGSLAKYDMPGVFVFQKLTREARAVGIKKADQEESREWFWNQARQVRGVNVDRMMAGTPSRMFARMGPESTGSMVQFWYDAKHKKTLPYWDRFPLIFVVADKGDRFQGINLHYLPPTLRARLMNGLYEIAIRNEQNKIVKLRLSYGLLTAITALSVFKPCFKVYLKSHLTSKFMYVPPSDWDKALFLPTARFVGASEGKVWADSRKHA